MRRREFTKTLLAGTGALLGYGCCSTEEPKRKGRLREDRVRYGRLVEADDHDLHLLAHRVFMYGRYGRPFR